MPPINVFRGDAPARAQILRIGPPPADQVSGRFEFTINDKTLLVSGWNAADIAAAWEALSVPEFAEITAAPEEAETYEDAALILTGPAAGTPFEVSVAATGFMSIETVQQGANPVNEQQTVTLPAATAGTWTLAFDGDAGVEGTTAIAWDASAAAVRTALEGLASIEPGDVEVTGAAGGPYIVEFQGQFTGEEVPDLTLDASGLTLDTDNFLTIETLVDGSTGEDADLTIRRLEFGTPVNLYYAGSVLIFSADSSPSASSIKSFLDGVDGNSWTVTETATDSQWRLQLPGSELPVAGEIYWGQDGSTENDDTLGSITGTYGIPQNNESQRVTLNGVTGGTFTLSFSGQTTAAIAWDADAPTVKAALESLTNIIAVNVFGAAGGPWEVEFVDPGFQDVDPMTGDGSALQAAGEVEETGPHDPGESEIQLVTMPASVTGGTFALLYGGDRTASIAHDASGAIVQTALEGIEAIGTGGVSVQEVAARQWQVTFASAGNVAELSADASGLTASTLDLVHLLQIAGGPTHWNDPLNWTLVRPPESGDEVWLDQAGFDVLHSLRQRCGITLHDADTDTLAADGSMHFADGQKITLRTDDTLPGGLASGDYYVVDADMANRIFKVSVTRGGSPVDLTTAVGSGNHLAVVELDSLHVAARHSGALGLPRRNGGGYWEYRPTYLEIGFDPAGTKLLKIGEGEGAGSGRVRIDYGTDEVSVRILNTSGGTERGVPAALLVGQNAATDVVQLDGDSGLAVFPGEACEIGDLEVRSGLLYGGEGLIVAGDVVAAPGVLRGQYLDSAGKRHRLEG